ncbi:uncharacterized protein N7500_009772 [Penicillium coprophilum]|uniref:uncharacterized protein n=1 Tax=Penicillium coprophilum TaxID=36646 RepID=UPI002395E50C|nr:uncharacterized protein N7500_009772 [Penicillium coprophilum]KAJ5154333.1 hypothetical protein N7500_009772 [Penicillium coprophilum]
MEVSNCQTRWNPSTYQPINTISPHRMARLTFGDLAVLVPLRAVNNDLEITANTLQTTTDVVINGD